MQLLPHHHFSTTLQFDEELNPLYGTFESENIEEKARSFEFFHEMFSGVILMCVYNWMWSHRNDDVKDMIIFLC